MSGPCSLTAADRSRQSVAQTVVVHPAKNIAHNRCWWHLLLQPKILRAVVLAQVLNARHLSFKEHQVSISVSLTADYQQPERPRKREKSPDGCQCQRRRLFIWIPQAVVQGGME